MSETINPEQPYQIHVHRFTSNLYGSGLGFQIEYESSNVTQWSYSSDVCGGSFTTPNGILTSPSYPSNYPNYADCSYTISQPTGTAILLNFLSMRIQYDTWCRLDYLEIRDGPLNDSTLLVKHCGNGIPAPIQSSQNQLWIK